MKIRVFISIYFLILLLSPNNIFSQGLSFHSNDETVSKRTSYNVFNTEEPTFEKHLTIKFDLSIIDPNPYGYICFIKDQESNTSYSLIIAKKDEVALLQLNIESKRNLFKIPIKMNDLGFRKWHSIIIDLDIENDSIGINIDKRHYKTVVKNFSKRIKPQIIFGKHAYVVDVPKMSIRNLTINGGHKSYAFKFNESDGSEVHDITGKSLGKVENPAWLIKESYHWKLRHSVRFEKVAAVNYDEKYQRMIMLNNDSVFFYDFSTNHTTSHKYKNEFPILMRLGMSFLDTLNNKLYVYEVNDVRLGSTTISALDLSDFSWENISTEQLKYQRHHHTGFFNSEKLLYTIFGGFGDQRYLPDFNTFDIQKNMWTKINYTGDEITPRFFSGQAIIDKDNALIFGGIGNKTGDQNLGKSYNYDCYRVNYSQHTVKKLWSTQVSNSGLVSVRNMILADDKKSFYTLCYAEYLPKTFLQLYQFSIADGTYKKAGDSIPMNSDRIETNANLYRNYTTKEMYCVTQEFSPNGSSTVKIYSLSEPPLSIDVLNNSKNLNFSKWLWLILLIVLVILIISLIYLRRRFVNKNRSIEQQSILKEITELHISNDKKVPNAVYLFDFMAVDKTGKDISYLFSPKIKQLFLFIVLNSIENGDGVNSAQIYSEVWPKKSVESAKNLKGVVLNQIRKILMDIEGIELVLNNGFYLFEMKAPFYCDYIECKMLLNEMIPNNENEEVLLDSIIPLISQDTFLKHIEFACLELFKVQFKENLLTIFVPLLEKYYKKQDYLRVIHITQIISNNDELNEIAFGFELAAYLKLDMINLAAKRYNAFTVAYKMATGVNYPQSFKTISSRKLI